MQISIFALLLGFIWIKKHVFIQINAKIKAKNEYLLWIFEYEIIFLPKKSLYNYAQKMHSFLVIAEKPKEGVAEIQKIVL